MQISDFDFDLPKELIAKFPASTRSASRLLFVPQVGAMADLKFVNFLEKITPNDLVIFNNTKVLKARLSAFKKTGAKLEILVERVLNENQVLAHIRGAKKLSIGDEVIIKHPQHNQNLHFFAKLTAKENNLCELQFDNQKSVWQWLDEFGEIPLPPYLERQAESGDLDRYQTVYSEKLGAVAAPTAGLHFDATMLNQLKICKIKTAFVTLHVGAGTFAPMRVENILEHKMHSEYIEVSQDVCDLIIQTKNNGGRVIAIGTTTLRAIETAALHSNQIIEPFYGDTDIFFYPGKKFQIIDALLTNFHLPKSTLLMLVSAFAGAEKIKTAYQHAISQKYRFFSYGDAMFLEKSA